MTDGGPNLYHPSPIKIQSHSRKHLSHGIPRCYFRCHLYLNNNAVCFSVTNHSFWIYEIFFFFLQLKFWLELLTGVQGGVVNPNQVRLALSHIQVVRAENQLLLVLGWHKGVQPLLTAIMHLWDGHRDITRTFFWKNFISTPISASHNCRPTLGLFISPWNQVFLNCNHLDIIQN